MLEPGKTYDEVYRSSRWVIPEFYTIGVDICDKWAHKLANALRAYGIDRGDRVGILLPQCPETAFSHMALYTIGAIAIPLFTLFGPDALEYRLADSEAKGIVTDGANLDKIMGKELRKMEAQRKVEKGEARDT